MMRATGELPIKYSLLRMIAISSNERYMSRFSGTAEAGLVWDRGTGLVGYTKPVPSVPLAMLGKS